MYVKKIRRFSKTSSGSDQQIHILREDFINYRYLLASFIWGNGENILFFKGMNL
jgi:hypothetical protein